MKIEQLTSDRDLVATALQSLWRERTQAYNTAITVAQLSNTEAPEEHLFGIAEVNLALRRIGAAPIR